MLRLNLRQIEFVFRWQRDLGEVFPTRGMIPGHPVITNHPDHVRSLFTARPELTPSITAESPLRPIVGPRSVLTANGPRHLRQRKLLLPPFHGEAIERYVRMISEVTERAIDRWPVGTPFALAPRMQDITLDVIMAGILGVDATPARGTPEFGLRTAVKWIAKASTTRPAQLAELMNVGKAEPVGLQRQAVAILDRFTYPVIAARRGAPDLDARTDILSLIMRARTEDGEPLTDRELRDELLTLILAGFETTANSLAWTWERLVRSPAAYERLREAVRSGVASAEKCRRRPCGGARLGRRAAWGLAALAGERLDHLVALSVGHPGTRRTDDFRQHEKSWYLLLFQFAGIAEEWLSANGWANFRAWSRHPDAAP